MKMLIISDIHGNLPALQAVLKSAGKVDKVICLGDMAGYFPYVNEVIEIISSMNNLICVMGNHDYVLVNSSETTGSRSADAALVMQRRTASDSTMRFIMNLPKTVTSEIDGSQVFLFHGTPADPLAGKEPFWEDSSLRHGIYFFGHSHKQFFKKESSRGFMAVNPGSCGFPRDGDPKASYVLLDSADWKPEFYRIEYPIDIVLRQCAVVGLPEIFPKSLKAGRWLSNQN